MAMPGMFIPPIIMAKLEQKPFLKKYVHVILSYTIVYVEVSPVWQACPSANMILPNQNNSKYIALFVYTWDWDVYNHLKTVVSVGIF